MRFCVHACSVVQSCPTETMTVAHQASFHGIFQARRILSGLPFHGVICVTALRSQVMTVQNKP